VQADVDELPLAGREPDRTARSAPTSPRSGSRCGSPGCRRRAPAAGRGRRSRSSTPARAGEDGQVGHRDAALGCRGRTGSARRRSGLRGPGAGRRSRGQRGQAPGLGFQHDVGAGHQRLEPRPAFGAVEVEHHAALAGVIVPPPQAAIGAGLVVEERRIATRAGSPPGGSTRITSAPMSASSLPAKAIRSFASSITRMPLSALISRPPRAAAPRRRPTGRAAGRTPPRCARRGTARGSRSARAFETCAPAGRPPAPRPSPYA
jgi:hypothetical protein